MTPEIVQLDWPTGSDLHAYDRSDSMIETVWAPPHSVQGEVTCALWQQLPCDDESVDLFVGDCPFGATSGLDVVAHVLAELARVLRPGGRIVTRNFIRPDAAECLAEIKDDAMAGRIRRFGSFKWRIGMHLVDPVTESIPMKEILRAFDELFPDRHALAERTGWPIEEINTIDAYQGVNEVVIFPTLASLTEMFGRHFEILAIDYPTYELGERCPTISMRHMA